jgi:hypothetical protein
MSVAILEAFRSRAGRRVLGLLLASGLGPGCSTADAVQTGLDGATGGSIVGAGSGDGGDGMAGCGPSGDLDASAPDASTEALEACQACELGVDPTVVPSCDPAFLGATKDPTGAPLGWGLATLATAAERRAGEALLHCLNVNDCAANAGNTGPGDNAALGCFCGGGVAGLDCLGGQGVHGPCVPEYEAAAAATPGGPDVCASLATFSAFVATTQAGSGGPISVADNIKRCAIDAQCSSCDAL